LVACVPALLSAALAIAGCLGVQNSTSKKHARRQQTPLRYVARTHACDRFAAPWGTDDGGAGTAARPFRTPTKLDRTLFRGQTGCLLAGTYGDVNTRFRLTGSGTRSARITITSYPGQTATLVGWVDIEGSYTTVSHLKIDGSNTFYRYRRDGTSCHYPVSQGLAIGGHDDTLQYNDYYQSVPGLRGNGIGIGWWGDVDNTIIRYNKIHDVGGCDFYDHLIYLARGNNVQIYDNWLWNDPHGWGIKLDPAPTNAKIWGNVIDAAGSGFTFGNSSGDQPTAGNQVFDNVVLDSVGVFNPDIGWGHPGVLVTSPGLGGRASSGNRVYDNVSYHNPGGIANIAPSVTRAQLALHDNVTRDPQFVDQDAHDYQLRTHSTADPSRASAAEAP